MRIALEFFQQPFIETLGWTLLHFLWQGSAIAGLLLVAQILLKRSSASARYWAACLALLLMAMAPVITFNYLETPHQGSIIRPAFVSVVSQEAVIAAPATAALPISSDPVPLQPQKRSFLAQVHSSLPWLVAAWLSAVLVLSLRLLIGWLYVAKIKHSRAESLGEEWEEKLAALIQRLKIKRPIRLLKSVLVEVPTVIGWLRPVILLPASSLTNLTPGQLEAILAHELSHIRRHDYLVNLLQSAVETLLFYHPAVWWVSRHMSEERENCCDDLTIKICGDRIAYAKALAALEELRGAPLQLTLAAGGGSLLQRIRRLLGVPTTSNRSGWWVAGAVLLLILAGLVMASRSSLLAADSSQPPSRAAESAPKLPLLQFRLVAAENDQLPSDELPDSTDRTGTAQKLRVLKEALLDESALESARLQESLLDGRTEIAGEPDSGNPSTLETMVRINEDPVKVFTRSPEFTQNKSLSVELTPQGLAISFLKRAERPIFSGPASSEFSDYGKWLFQTVAWEMARFPSVQLGIEGHMAQGRGNRQISMERAKSARKLLVDTGVKESCIQTLTAYGDEKPLKNLSPEDPSQERVTIILQDPKRSATNPDSPSENRTTASLVQDARLLIEMGKLDKAETKLKQAAQQDPEHTDTQHYLNYIKSIRQAREARVRVVTPNSNTPSPNERLQPPLKREHLPAPGPALRTNLVYTSPGRERIRQKLSQIILDEVLYDGLSLSEVVKHLNQEAQKRDPEKRGINFIINSQVDVPPPNGTPDSQKEKPSYTKPLDLGKVIIRLQPPLRNVRLDDVLDAVTLVADRPLKYSVEDYAVVFTEKRPEPPQLFTRTFKVDPNTFMENLEDWFSSASNSKTTSVPNPLASKNTRDFGPQTPRKTLGDSAPGKGSEITSSNLRLAEMFRTLILNSGIDIPRGTVNDSGGNPVKAIYYNDRVGILYARATLEELDHIEKIVQLLNTGPAQVVIEVKFAEITKTDSKALGFDWFLGSMPPSSTAASASTNLGTVALVPVPPGGAHPNVPSQPTNSGAAPTAKVEADPQFPGVPPTTNGVKSRTNPPVTTITGLLTEAQFRSVLGALEHRSGVDILSTPSVTTLSGRSARIEVTQPQTVVLPGEKPKGNFPPGTHAAVVVPVGTSLDVTPNVLKDGDSIQLTLSANVAEFLGYDDPGPFAPNAPAVEGNQVSVPKIATTPLPRFQVRQVESKATVRDGETLVLSGFRSLNLENSTNKVPVLGDLPLRGRFFRSETNEPANKQLILFVTPTIIDPAGNRVRPPASPALKSD